MDILPLLPELQPAHQVKVMVGGSSTVPCPVLVDRILTSSLLALIVVSSVKANILFLVFLLLHTYYLSTRQRRQTAR